MNSKISLRILALFFWFYTIVFILSVLPFLGIKIPSLFFTEFRGDTYQWDFELMFTVISAVWGYYLWRASTDIPNNKIFIDFTIWATVFHILAMLVVGLLRPSDLSHMLLDAFALSIPLVLVILTLKKSW